MRIAIALTMALLAGGAHAQAKKQENPKTIFEQAGAAKGAIRGIMQNDDVRSCSTQGWISSDQCSVIARAVMLTLVERCKEYGECPTMPFFPTVTNADLAKEATIANVWEPIGQDATHDHIVVVDVPPTEVPLGQCEGQNLCASFPVGVVKLTKTTCADKSRFLMTAEDGTKHCISLKY